MKCIEFEMIVAELAREQLIESSLRRSGIDHSEQCGRCAARLADERALSAGLSAVAAIDAGQSSADRSELDRSDRIEAVLIEAFRQNSRTPSAIEGAGVSPRILAFPGGRGVLALVAAAMLLVFVGVAAYRTMLDGSRTRDLISDLPPPAQSPLVTAVTARQGETALIGEPEVKRESDLGQRAAYRRPASDRSTRLVIKDGMTLYASEDEIVTDYLLLSQSRGLVPLDRGQVIRVEFPRSALVSFGLPINVEREDTMVKADLLVGEDGLARAIRFVR